MLQLCRGWCVGLRVPHRHRLRNCRRARRIDGLHFDRFALVIRPIDAWRDEEQDLATRAGRQLSLEEITEHRNRSKARCALVSLTFAVCEDAAHYSRASIWNQDFRL